MGAEEGWGGGGGVGIGGAVGEVGDGEAEFGGEEET